MCSHQWKHNKSSSSAFKRLPRRYIPIGDKEKDKVTGHSKVSSLLDQDPLKDIPCQRQDLGPVEGSLYCIKVLSGIKLVKDKVTGRSIGSYFVGQDHISQMQVTEKSKITSLPALLNAISRIKIIKCKVMGHRPHLGWVKVIMLQTMVMGQFVVISELCQQNRAQKFSLLQHYQISVNL